jgi:hypothetical protein
MVDTGSGGYERGYLHQRQRAGNAADPLPKPVDIEYPCEEEFQKDRTQEAVTRRQVGLNINKAQMCCSEGAALFAVFFISATCILFQTSIQQGCAFTWRHTCGRSKAGSSNRLRCKDRNGLCRVTFRVRFTGIKKRSN